MSAADYDSAQHPDSPADKVASGATTESATATLEPPVQELPVQDQAQPAPSAEAVHRGPDAGSRPSGLSENAAAELPLAESEASESLPPGSDNGAVGVADPSAAPDAADSLAEAMEVMQRLRSRMAAQVLGRDEVIDLVLVALVADGHVLLEDYPGSGKTTLAKALGAAIVDDRPDDDIVAFRRIQFTPDLLPSDVTGVSVFEPATSQFQFRRGPIFAHVVLADEINRTSPKVQAAMLEAMAEKQVTVDNVTHTLDPLFFVIATQNPLDLAGTYPLPAPQLDRFLFKIRMQHIDRRSEIEVLETYQQRRDTERSDLPRVSRDQLLACRQQVEETVAIDAAVKECLVDASRNLRADERVLQGNSTRSLVLILPALQALAALRGRDYVTSEDLQILAPRVLGHRVELAPGVNEMDEVIDDAFSEPLERLARSTLKR